MHPYLLWKPEAYGILDGARAAIAEYRLDNRVVLVGQSQGSAAALGARYLASSYAPGLHVAATVVTGLVVYLAKSVAGAPQVAEPSYAGGGEYDAAYSMLYLLGTDQMSDSSLNVDDYVSPRGTSLLHAALSACFTQLVQVAKDQHLNAKTAFTSARQTLLAKERSLGAFPSALLAGPIFTGTGLADAEAGTAPQYNIGQRPCPELVIFPSEADSRDQCNGDQGACLRYLGFGIRGQRLSLRQRDNRGPL